MDIYGDLCENEFVGPFFNKYSYDKDINIYGEKYSSAFLLPRQ